MLTRSICNLALTLALAHESRQQSCSLHHELHSLSLRDVDRHYVYGEEQAETLLASIK